MVLATHAIIGAAVGRLFLNPWLAFAAGFISHFFADAIPHWDHSLKSFIKDENDHLKNDMVLNRDFLWDLGRLGTDTLTGFAIAFVFFPGSSDFLSLSWAAMAGAVGGVFPDLLQFFYFKIRRQPFIFIQKIHLFAHTKKRLAKFPYGIASQVALSLVAIIISQLIK